MVPEHGGDVAVCGDGLPGHALRGQSSGQGNDKGDNEDKEDKDKDVWFFDHEYFENMHTMFKKVNGNSTWVYFRF